MNVRAAPQISIGSGFLFRGEFDAFDIKHAICAAFKRKPLECRSSDKGWQLVTDPAELAKLDEK